MAQRVVFGAFGLSSGTAPLPWPTNTLGPTVTDDLLPMTTLGCGVFRCCQSSPSTGFSVQCITRRPKAAGEVQNYQGFQSFVEICARAAAVACKSPPAPSRQGIRRDGRVA